MLTWASSHGLRRILLGWALIAFKGLTMQMIFLWMSSQKIGEVPVK